MKYTLIAVPLHHGVALLFRQRAGLDIGAKDSFPSGINGGTGAPDLRRLRACCCPPGRFAHGD
ncbi:hypothetical protein OG204_34470 [Streptomyces sp. NBC_01387]|uniref:hypothetical protein n=1 Tax=unclassified Streptomyces TaxID=2593676 RepID=UPI0020253361|nr:MULTISPECIES: hypothetical protein [unclassified Streptomyces]MCX4553294.1 hypothetical protein [Streptomyces sp. NBC_01500]WSV52302.1 hypothetical protein OG282_00680 [Streptomyces sp. NBC_01014]